MGFEIFLEHLKVNAIIGILSTERTKMQEISVDLRAKYIMESSMDFSNFSVDYFASFNDEIVNYAILREIILDLFKQNEFFYLENALVAIQHTILERFPQILELDLSIKKLEIFSDCIPQVRLSWQKQSSEKK